MGFVGNGIVCKHHAGIYLALFVVLFDTRTPGRPLAQNSIKGMDGYFFKPCGLPTESGRQKQL